MLYMRNHLSKSFKVDNVAEAEGVSRRSLEMRFRADRDVSPGEFLLDLRLQKARAFLSTNTRLSTEEIARLCGFGTGKNLRAAFARVLNASPNDFRPR
jgi:AraC family transcriptional activator FtrA